MTTTETNNQAQRGYTMNDNTFKAAVIVAIGSGAVGFFGSLGFACLYMLATFNGAN